MAYIFIYMAQIIVAWLWEGQKIHLTRSRKPEGALKNGELPHTNKSGEVIAYRKTLKTNNIEWVKLNRVIAKEWDNEKTGKSWSYSLVISTWTGSHRIDLGWGMLATSVMNTFCSLLHKTKEEIETMSFNMNFYQNKKGYNTCYITDQTGQTLDWYMSPEEVESLIKRAPNPVDPTKTLANKADLMHRYMELADALNLLLPKSAYSTGSALDGIDDDLDDDTTQSLVSDADDIFDTAPATDTKAKTEPEDLPFV